MPRRSGATPLSEDRILDAALRLIDEGGIRGFSMRRLGAYLGVDPMAVYHYFPGKEPLLRSLTLRQFSVLQAVDRSGAWPQRVRAWATAYRRLALAHPNLVLELVANVDALLAAVPVANEALEEALKASGLQPAQVQMAAYMVVDYVNGLVLGEVAIAEEARESRSFDFALDVIIAGLQSLIDAGATS